MDFRLKNKFIVKNRVSFTRIQRDRESTATSRQDNHTRHRGQLYQSRQEGREEDRREVKGHDAGACLELLFPYVFTGRAETT